MAQLNILIAGAGIAGPVAAYWLSKAGHEITVVERDSQLRATGQSIDIREAAVEVIRKMGLEKSIASKCTDEAGIAFVDAQDRVRAAFAASGDTANQSFTSEFEILRGDLAITFYEATKGLPNVTYVFGEHIESVEQPTDSKRVTVGFAAGKRTATYDLVIGADGLGSRTRSLAFHTTTREHIWSFDMFSAYFTADIDLLGDDKYSRWFNAPGRRCILIRPDPQRRTRATLTVIHDGQDAQRERHESAFRSGADAIRAVMTETFRGAGWKTPQLLDAMASSDDLYGTEVAQIRMDRIVTGRVALVGDAGYSPTPLTGMGTSLAIIGAYVLAGEVSKFPDDVPRALEEYQSIVHPYARKVQGIPRWVPKLVNPATAWGIGVQHFILGWVSWLKLDVFGSFVTNWLPGGASAFDLPFYEWKGR